MDKIIAKGLVFEACHGVLPEEQIKSQKFVVDLILYKDLVMAGRSDDLAATVSYAEVYQLVQQIVTGKSFALIEALAENIAGKILNNFDVAVVQVTVYKPQAPVEGEFDYFAVEITRSKLGL